MSQQQATQFNPATGIRRSQRVLLRARVVVHGLPPESDAFGEETHTLVVNAHGGLISLGTRVKLGQMLVLENWATGEKAPCRVASLGQSYEGKAQVGIEFTRPAAKFWHIDFPPADWKPLPD